jgi:hypothetical protein
MPTPFEILDAEYAARPEIIGHRPLAWYVEHYGTHGFIRQGPGYFIMGRPVVKGAPEALVLQWDHDFPWGVCDCWYVQAMAGNLVHCLADIPWELPWVGFVRIFKQDLNLRYYPIGTLRRMLQSNQF